MQEIIHCEVLKIIKLEITMQNHIKKTKRYAAIGLWGSVGAVIVAAVLCYALHTVAGASRWMLIAGTVLAVLAVSMMLLSVRRQIPILRQTEGLEKKLKGYELHVRDLYMTMLAVVVILCAFTFLSGRTVLLMLAMVSTLVLFLNYPNIYRIKVDLGLTDDEAKELFGDRYIPDTRDTGNEQ